MSKYKNKKVTLQHKGEAVVFDSQAEAARFSLLQMLEKSGGIQNLELQPEYQINEPFSRNGKRHRAITYVADFRYELEGETVVEDVKGMKTAVYQLKKKLFLKLYGENLTFMEVFKSGTRFKEKVI